MGGFCGYRALNAKHHLSVALIKQIAVKIMADLGAGYSECCYQTALYNKFVKIDPSVQMEKSSIRR